MGESAVRAAVTACGLMSLLVTGADASTIDRVAELRIFFGHQSVGLNIIDGLRDVARAESGRALSIVQTGDAAVFDRPVFAHSWIGSDTDAVAKIRDFARLVEHGIGGRADVAFMKLCYVDIDRATDVRAVFLAYKTSMARLKTRYPQTTFVHVTMPLVAHQTGLQVTAKAIVKTLIGRPVRDESLNIERSRFNDLLRAEYGDREPVFDLERIESTRPHEGRLMLTTRGRAFPALLPEYTDDGGHLNAVGGRVVGAELLRFLRAVAEARQPRP
jgi:hypothetical protein